MDPDLRGRERDRLAAAANLDRARMPPVDACQIVDHERGMAREDHVASAPTVAIRPSCRPPAR
jgi:hypothetical protein